MFWRVYSVIIPSWYAFAVTSGTSIYAPGVFDIEAKLYVSQTVAILGLSLYTLGLGLGPVVGAPISETLGRRWVYIITMPLMILFTLGAGLSRKISSLLACRFFAAFFGGPAVAVGAGSIADVWDLQGGGGIAGSIFILLPFLGSSIAPLVGGFAVQHKHSWNWTMWILIVVGGPAWFANLLLPETSEKIILQKRAKARGQALPPKLPPKQALTMLMTVTLFRPIHMLITEPIIGWLSLYVAFAFGILFCFFDAFPYVFIRVYGFSLGQVGLTYLSIVVGVFLAAIIYVIVDKTIYAKAKAKVAGTGMIPPPEQRLYVSMLASFLLPISLFWFAWASKKSVHWIGPVLSGLPFGCALVSLFFGNICYLMDTYQALNAASAVAANGLLRYTFAAMFPLFTVQMYNGIGVGWATSLLGFISVAMMPIPWILYKWGPRIRSRSSYKVGKFE